MHKLSSPACENNRCSMLSKKGLLQWRNCAEVKLKYATPPTRSTERCVLDNYNNVRYAECIYKPGYTITLMPTLNLIIDQRQKFVL